MNKKIKIGGILIGILLGFSLGSITQNHVCNIAKQEMGTGTSFMKLTCTILTLPIDLILIIFFLVGLIGYLIWDYNNS